MLREMEPYPYKYGDTTSFVRFHLFPVEVQKPNVDAGIPAKYVNELFVEVRHSKNTAPDVKVTKAHMEAWPEAYEKFKETEEYQEWVNDDSEYEVESFTKLETIAGLGAARIKTLKDWGIHNLEQLVKFDVSVLPKWAGVAQDKARNILRNGKTEDQELLEETTAA